jgi:hypothetical protein
VSRKIFTFVELNYNRVIRGGATMRIKKAAQLAVIGIILNILPAILNFFVPFNKAFLISSYIRTFGNVLLVIFFYVFIVRQQETSTLKTAGVLGLIGYLITVVLNVSGIIFNSVFNIAVKDPIKYLGLINTSSMLNRINFLMGLIPIILMIVCFMVFHRNLIDNNSFKKVVMLALIGQFILLTEWMAGFIFKMSLSKMLYQIFSIRGLAVILIITQQFTKRNKKSSEQYKCYYFYY